MDRRPLRVAFWMLSVALALVGALTISAPDSIRLVEATTTAPEGSSEEQVVADLSVERARHLALVGQVRESTATIAGPRHAPANSPSPDWPFAETTSPGGTPTLSEVLADIPDDPGSSSRAMLSRGMQNRLVAHAAPFEELPQPPEVPSSLAAAGRPSHVGLPQPNDVLISPLKELTSELTALRSELQSAARRDAEQQRETLEGLRSDFRSFTDSQRAETMRSELTTIAERQSRLETVLLAEKEAEEKRRQEEAERAKEEANAQGVPTLLELTPSSDDPNLWNARFLNADPGQVIRRISDAGGWNLVVGASLSGTVTTTLANVKLEDVLAAAAKSLDAVVIDEAGYRMVVPASQGAIRRRTTERTLAKVIRLKYLSAIDVLPLVRPLLTPGVGEAAMSTPVEEGAQHPVRAQADVLLVLDYEEAVAQIEALVAEIDTPPVQIEIDAVITTFRTSERSRWGAINALRSEGVLPSSDSEVPPSDRRANRGRIVTTHTGQFRGSPRKLLRHLEDLGETRVEATPSLRVLNRQMATLTVGRDIGFERWQTVSQRGRHKEHDVDFLPTSAHLCVRPFLWGDHTVRLQVHPQLSHVTIDPVTGIPRRDLVEVETDLLIPLGCTAVIGGLTLHRNDQGLQPEIRSRRWLKWPTRKVGDVHDQETIEVVILLTPRIVQEEVIHETPIHRPANVPPEPTPEWQPPESPRTFPSEQLEVPAEPSPSLDPLEPLELLPAIVTDAETPANDPDWLTLDASTEWQPSRSVLPVLHEMLSEPPSPEELAPADIERERERLVPPAPLPATSPWWPQPPLPAPPLRLPTGL